MPRAAFIEQSEQITSLWRALFENDFTDRIELTSAARDEDVDWIGNEFSIDEKQFVTLR